ncbi:MAG: heavy metal-binding domain-containing protein, partial [Desulfuromonadales bacterium]|nr:heavy metal-binding domain-containing protein [Desulfuromonadales bacterium]
MDILIENLNLVVFLILFVMGYVIGSWAEKRHYRSIMQREKELIKLAVVTAEGSFPPGRVKDSALVTGSVVISIDYFKRILATLRNIFGGRVKSYESLVDRARREAILRMKEQAQKRGAKMIINM